MANYSLAEIDALSRKACRGAGYSWGLAEDAGKAIRWLTAYGLPGAETLAEFLPLIQSDFTAYVPELKDTLSNNKSNQLCPIYCGAIINDQGHLLLENRTLTFESMMFPLLSLGQAAKISEAYEMPIGVSFGGANIVCTRESIKVIGNVDWRMQKTNVTCQKTDADSISYSEQLFPSPLSRDVSADAIKVLESFAHKTYAPATEASRIAGAGAGLSDND